MKTVRLFFVCFVLSLVAGCDNGSSTRAEVPAPIDFSDTVHSPRTMHAVWCTDPTSTISIRWLREVSDVEAPDTPTIAYRPVGSDAWEVKVGDAQDFPVVEPLDHPAFPDQPSYQRVDLNDLLPAQEYEFAILPYRTVYRFRTAPEDLSSPLRFVVGGDMNSTSITAELNRVAAAEEPLFAVLGGDLAYSDGEDTQAVFEWLEMWSENMRGAGDRLIPMLPVIGNHEISGGSRYDDSLSLEENRVRGPFFFSMFECLYPSTSYAAFDFSDYLTFLLLDSQHTTPVAGQSDWLLSEVASRQSRSHVYPVYHIAAYPSVRPYDYGPSELIREEWVPIFESGSINVAFEHHDHAYKRTWPLLGGEIDEESGIVYVGDGAWGRSVRSVHSLDDAPFLYMASSVYHVLVVDVEAEGDTHIRAIDPDGAVVDEFTVPAQTP